MTLRVYTHPSSHLHVTPPGHPERVARLESIETRMSDPAFDALIRHPTLIQAASAILGPDLMVWWSR